MNHSSPIRSSRRPRARWTTLDWAASLSISAFWHLLVLAVLALAVHPFQLPDASRPVELQILPDLVPPPTPSVDVELEPRAPPPKPQPPPEPPKAATPQPPIPLRPVEAEPQPVPPQPPQETVRSSDSALANPVEVQKRPAQAPRLQTLPAAPKISPLPPEPVTVNRPAPVLAPPIEAPRAQAPSRAPPLDASRAAPQIPQTQIPQAQASPAPSEAQAPAPAAPQVLTNNTVIQAPVEIRPRERAPAAPRLETQGGAPEITAPAQGGAPAAGGGLPSIAGGGAQGGALKPYTGFNGSAGTYGQGRGGLRTDLGCENPDAYKLSDEERAACLQKFGARGRAGPDLGLNIPARKQAEYDHDVACHRYTTQSIPGSDSGSSSTSIPGLGYNPSLRECKPGER